MSVAFRREGDEEHLEPKFELPIPPGPNLVTPRGLALTRAKVAELEAALPAIAEEDARKAALRQLRYWRTRQATALLAPAPDGRTVELGCSVTFRLGGKERRLAIVGDDEADPAAGMIAFAAPLARALIGAEPGEWLEFAGKPDAIEVVEIRITL
jgi:transcription elongation GreA/GreB family factor